MAKFIKRQRGSLRPSVGAVIRDSRARKKAYSGWSQDIYEQAKKWSEWRNYGESWKDDPDELENIAASMPIGTIVDDGMIRRFSARFMMEGWMDHRKLMEIRKFTSSSGMTLRFEHFESSLGVYGDLVRKWMLVQRAFAATRHTRPPSIVDELTMW